MFANSLKYFFRIFFIANESVSFKMNYIKAL